MKNDEMSYDAIYRKLQQQEQTISQLLAIIAVNNRKLNELDKRQVSLEQHTRYLQLSFHTNIAEGPPLIPTNMSSSK